MKKRCIICNKPYDYYYSMFGRSCLDNLYELLGFSKPFRILNKENYLCTRIAWKNHEFFLNKNKKHELAKKYIALSYLNKMNYDSLNDTREKLKNDIKSVSVFSKAITNTISFTLNDIYKLYNYYQKFNEFIKELTQKYGEENEEFDLKDYEKDEEATGYEIGVYDADNHILYYIWESI